jgi:hypothetical protein
MIRSYALPLRPLTVLLIAVFFLAACAPGQTDTPSLPPSTNPPPTATPAGPATGTPTPALDRPTPDWLVMGEPPPATLTIGGQSQVSGIGSYCWNTSSDPAGGIGLCVDKMGLITPLDPLIVPAGPLTAEFLLPIADSPSEVLLTVYPAQGEPSIFDGGQGWMPSFDAAQSFDLALAPAQSIALELEPGLYVFSVFTRWDAWGDVAYGFLVQVGEGQADSAAFTLPASCIPASPDRSPYVDPGGRYCLQFPNYFRIGDVTLDRASFYGPPLDQSVEPVFASLGLAVEGPAAGRTLAEIVDAFVAENGLGLPIARRALTLGGQPAEVLEGMPGRALSWQAFVLHQDTVYHLSLFPMDPALPQAEVDALAVWQAVETSLTFLP